MLEFEDLSARIVSGGEGFSPEEIESVDRVLAGLLSAAQIETLAARCPNVTFAGQVKGCVPASAAVLVDFIGLATCQP